MAKDPAFLFYPGDWLGGTMAMTFEERGAYLHLLILQFNVGHMTSHMAAHEVGQHWDKLKVKFVQDENGLWFNVKLEYEKNKRKSFTDSRKNNLKGENQYSKKHKNRAHMTSHMENENEDIIIDKKAQKKINTMPLSIEIGDLPEIKIGAAQQLLKITKQTDVTKDQISGMWAVFKNQNLTGKKYYADIDDIYSHFINWVKDKKFEKLNQEKKSERIGKPMDQILKTYEK